MLLVHNNYSYYCSKKPPKFTADKSEIFGASLISLSKTFDYEVTTKFLLRNYTHIALLQLLLIYS